MKTFLSDLSQKEFPAADKIPGSAIRHSLLAFIQKEHPAFTDESYLSISELNQYRERYITDYLVRETGELNDLEQTVLDSVNSRTSLTHQIDGDEPARLTTGQMIADKVASFGGSWVFISLFGAFLLVWILVNVYWLANRGFDPYPFILLNLILSCIAAIQAPVIMMSQNRQEDKDRERAKKDYMINLKSELEIRVLHEKLDHLILHQQQELLEIQKDQIDMMSDILRRLDHHQKGA
jgi:uncharacterized membrane protein